MAFETDILSNGIRVIHHHVNSRVAHCGLIINAGSRDEDRNEFGLAHFIEHMLFKGTKTRTSYDIADQIEAVGGEINAYTTKEDTCIHVSFLYEDYPQALELMSDMLCNSEFPNEAMENEKQVIIDEIQAYQDTPSELIFDEYENMLFQNNPLGHNILGDPDQLRLFQKDHVLEFMNKQYVTDRIIISSVGNIGMKQLVLLAETYFGNYKTAMNGASRALAKSFVRPRYKDMEKGTFQAHCIVGSRAYPYKHENRWGLNLLNNYLCGFGFSSRLNMKLREQAGLVYNIESVYQPYFDSGVFSIYFGTDHSHIETCLSLLYDELEVLRNNLIEDSQLQKAKRQLKGQATMAMENYENLMLMSGKQMYFYNTFESLEEVYSKIESISSAQLQMIANEILNPDNIGVLIFR